MNLPPLYTSSTTPFDGSSKIGSIDDIFNNSSPDGIELIIHYTHPFIFHSNHYRLIIAFTYYKHQVKYTRCVNYNKNRVKYTNMSESRRNSIISNHHPISVVSGPTNTTYRSEQ